MSFVMAGVFDWKPGSDASLGLLPSPTLLLLRLKIGQIV